MTLQLVRPVIRQSCILLAAVNSWASHNPASSKTTAIARPASARRWLPSCSGSGSFILRLARQAATERKLTDRTFDVEFDSSHLGEQVDIDAPDSASTQPHVGRHQVERLDQYADILQDERIRNRTVFPRNPVKTRGDRDQDLGD